MKKIFAIVVVLLLVFGMVCPILVGCTKLINTEYETVQVKIVDEYHRSAYSTPVRVGKAMTVRRHPAVYRVIVEYEGVEYSVSDSETWRRYKDMVGEIVDATLEIRKYDDGTVKYRITSLGKED